MSDQLISLDGTALGWDHLLDDVVLRLRAKGIQSVLWDRTAYSWHGVPMGFAAAYLAIDDEKISDAVFILDRAGLTSCKKGPNCEQAFHRAIPEIQPSEHIHMDKIFKNIEDDIQFLLYKRSRTLLEWPPLQTLPFQNQPPPYVPRTKVDRRLDAKGRPVMKELWKTHKGLWVPSVRALTRSFILLAAGSKDFDARGFWIDHVAEMLNHLYEQGRFNTNDVGYDVQPVIDWLTGVTSTSYIAAMEETTSRIKKNTDSS